MDDLQKQLAQIEADAKKAKQIAADNESEKVRRAAEEKIKQIQYAAQK